MADDLGPLPKIHPRHYVVEAARRAFNAFYMASPEMKELTTAEYLSLLADEMRTALGFAIRSERKESP